MTDTADGPGKAAGTPGKEGKAARYARTERTRLRRRHQHACYDREVVHGILDSALVCHIGFVVDGQPFVTPTAFWRMDEDIYFHGSAANRTFRAAASGIPVCVTVSHLDGIVHARSGFNSCMNFRSVMIFGKAVAVTDPAEKARCLDGLLDRLAPGRSREIRPSTAQELKATAVLRLPLVEVSAKVRQGEVGDDPAELDLPYWAGIVPVRTVIGTPIDDPELRPGIARPDNITRIRLGN
jgi:nitroimidazol reductase NimA-like FMN-containing flavoprotein (pyridoxamine 5'-phosphate oxidase superfamily)